MQVKAHLSIAAHVGLGAKERSKFPKRDARDRCFLRRAIIIGRTQRIFHRDMRYRLNGVPPEDTWSGFWRKLVKDMI
jgi:hypothetical protein